MIAMMILTSCASITSESYSAVGFIHGNTDNSAFMEFKKFKGNMVFTLKVEEGERIHYRASLEEGSATVYLESKNSKKELFTVDPTKKEDSSFEAEEETVIIIVETNETCKNGDIRFDIEEVL